MDQMDAPAPYGGELVNLLVDDERIELLKKIAGKLTELTLTDRQMCDVELLATGAFSPLRGFMVQSEYASVLDRMQLQNGLVWPLPICLDVNDLAARTLEAGQSVALRDAEGFLLAVMHIEDIFPAEKEKEAEKIYGTRDPAHPGVDHLMNACGDTYIGGRIEAIHLPPHFDFQRLRRSPVEIRQMAEKLGWNRMVGFHTRNPIHRPQFELTLKAMRKASANLLLLPTVGITMPGDFDHYTRIKCYREIAKRYPPDAHILNLLPLANRMAGPREALLHAIIARNFGCSHFIIGEHHGSPDTDQNGQPFYPGAAAREFAEAFDGHIGIQILGFQEMLYLPFEDEYRFADQVPDGTQTLSFSGFDIRTRIRTGRKVPLWASFPEVISALRKAYPPPRKQGLTVFFTGLSGAGKSTLAKILYARFMELGDRPVTLLDGDIVRQNLSRELSFSKEHRDINVRRIGFVASEITKNRGIAICAPIAPYASTRTEIRRRIEEYGGFAEVHVATPIEECEKRDRKGMYAKARAGLIKGFTGVDDPYEPPECPELRIDTTHMTPNEAVKDILLFLGEKGYI
ncbi:MULTISPECIES: bifunctional sulfate adenylyltransferase/adenylylsulfate kinase [Desulfococcus]|uniref:Adenylyl-sulfate kinase n=1 Tax=Desulfococcus multivorans DSM 2059 TaxID=1121405 RepID=S7TSL2_DESML|nr:bifunctional sulfate adenylyltransferase/adenylylsulfate kinase [Desulfococcus multivorans]EPR40016.1 Adenylyl-sulfate kinase [Desulfococcus multivorans DSM 2059]SKA01351.1 sulfate adenylyltransferase [Desulfococcus multivorans DSM 2059]